MDFKIKYLDMYLKYPFIDMFRSNGWHENITKTKTDLVNLSYRNEKQHAFGDAL